MALMATDLPEPVEPAMSTWGIDGEIGGDDAAVDVLAHGQREARLGLGEGFALEHVAQVDGLALVVGHLDADRALAGHALDENAFGAHGEAEIVGQAGDARVFDAGLGLELVGGDHGAGIDLHHLAAHVELGAFFDQHLGFFAQLVLADRLGAFAGVEQGAGRQLEAAHVLGGDGVRAHVRVGAAVNGDLAGGLRSGDRSLFKLRRRGTQFSGMRVSEARWGERHGGHIPRGRLRRWRSRCRLRGLGTLPDAGSAQGRRDGNLCFGMSWICRGRTRRFERSAPECGNIVQRVAFGGMFAAREKPAKRLGRRTDCSGS